ncbi:MAG: ABC transporter ATP-binding protein [Ruminococcaceae bacterium]|nr:ABC transporter ATP-binding protein [Oscillospiraceae bacterium]
MEVYTLLEIKDLVAEYRDGFVKGLSLTVSEKGIFGVLCAHSADRTAIAHVICGCADKESGDVLINGEAVTRQALKARKKIRLVPRELNIDGMTTPYEYLDFVADALEVAADKKYRQVSEALELLGLDEDANRPFFSLGKAQRCRLSIAAALIGNPDCIVVDDAFSGLDGKTAADILELLKMLGKRKTLILLSHKPAEIKELCEQMAVVSGGAIAIEGNIAEIEKKINATREMHINARGETDKIIEAIKGVQNVIGVKVTSTSANKVSTLVIEHYPDAFIKDNVFNALNAVNSQMLSYKEVKLTIDDVYYSLTLADVKRMEKTENDSSVRKGKKLARRNKR